MAATAVNVACYLASISPAPHWHLADGEMYFQAFPINRYRQGCDDVSEEIQFQLYTEASQPFVNLTLGDSTALSGSPFDRRRDTMLYLPGFGETPDGSTTIGLRDAFLARGGYNVIIGDFRRLVAAPWYATAVANTANIGRHVARFIDFLVDHGGLRLRKLHVIGISLGGQVAAAMGAAVRSGLVGRITGLDPAAPGYGYWTPDQLLNKAHAQFVDVIHTDVSMFGVNGSVGHADFYPNGGKVPQPGCKLEQLAARNSSAFEMVFCSHLQAYMFFMTSMQREDALPATRCRSWSNYQRSDCQGLDADADGDDDDVVHLGIATPHTARGNYYLSTLGIKIFNPFYDSFVNNKTKTPNGSVSSKTERPNGTDRSKTKRPNSSASSRAKPTN